MYIYFGVLTAKMLMYTPDDSLCHVWKGPQLRNSEEGRTDCTGPEVLCQVEQPEQL
jgi:hypothetical protein